MELNRDLKEYNANNKEVAYNHWINHGQKEGRLREFDWCCYVKKYNLANLNIDTKIKAINHWLDNGKPELNNQINYDEQLFDWKYYISHNSDLSHLQSYEAALHHWINYGIKEHRKSHNFKWTNYLLANSDLVNEGINTENQAIYHWINYGKKEKRKMC